MQTILVALDGAPSAEAVLHAAGELAATTHSGLVLFRACDLPGSPVDSGVDEERFAERLQAELLRDLELRQRTLPASISSRLRVGTGWAADSICAMAADEHADLIVIGAHGLGPMSGTLGEVTRRVLDQASCDVLVVKPQDVE